MVLMMALALQSPVRQKPKEDQAVKLGISLSRSTYDALVKHAEGGTYKLKLSQVIEAALKRFLETGETMVDPEGKE